MSSPAKLGDVLATLPADLRARADACRRAGDDAGAEALERAAADLAATVGTVPAVQPLPVDRLWNLEETSAYLQMSTSWVRRADIPVVQLGRARRYDPAQVKAFMERHLSHRIITPAPRRSA